MPLLNKLPPNTGVPDEFLHRRMILCCGEDAGELLQAAGNEKPVEEFGYRCYRFWRFADFTLTWTGIGSGCLEPLLFEILSVPIIEKIILIGTSGALSDRNSLGKPTIITEAFLAGAAVRRSTNEALHPRWLRPWPEGL